MSERVAKNSGFDVLFIFKIANKYRIHLILITIISIILAIIFSSESFVKPKFKSSAIAYPSNLVPYSTESPTEQMLQLFESDEIRDELISDFKLFEHYGIDTTDKFPLTNLYGQMSENIKIDKTKFESVEIEVLDTDPVIASRMVDSLLAKMHKKARLLQREKSGEVVVILKHQLDHKRSEMDSMEKALMDIRTKYGILDFENQVKAFSKVYYSELASGRASVGGNRPIDNAMNGLLNKGGEYVSLSEHLWRVRGTYNDLKIQYESAFKDLSKELTYSNIVTRPVPAEKKSYPVRSLIVIMFTGSMLLLAFIILVIYENSKRVAFNKSN
ncbi:MAG: hypothetical protein M3Q95_07340 [Bacteroidota bacterium]|nr:hypothetical protein [Bacteroidota bacterium]